jgi:hypothetical protein
MHKGNLTLQLFNLKDDISESRNVADQNPDVVRRMEAILAESHTPSQAFPLKALDR